MAAAQLQAPGPWLRGGRLAQPPPPPSSCQTSVHRAKADRGLAPSKSKNRINSHWFLLLPTKRLKKPRRGEGTGRKGLGDAGEEWPPRGWAHRGDQGSPEPGHPWEGWTSWASVSSARPRLRAALRPALRRGPALALTPGRAEGRTHPERAGHFPAVALQQAQAAPQGPLQAGVRQPALPAHGQQLQGQIWRGRIAVGSLPGPGAPAHEHGPGSTPGRAPAPFLVNELPAVHSPRGPRTGRTE